MSEKFCAGEGEFVFGGAGAPDGETVARAVLRLRERFQGDPDAYNAALERLVSEAGDGDDDGAGEGDA
jgi:Arc/MetJ family transcription regulator